uniref:Nucleoside diphosphate kinase-like domain-containing protein n=1 Tax=Romanomermis culicivorax TaxID=13658 RepID=A0A915KE13_ROMCU
MNNLSFAIIKPEIALYPSLCWFIIEKIFEQKNLNIIDAKWHKFSRPEAEKFYAVHKDKFFYERLVQHISSGHVVTLLLTGDNAVQAWRNLIGKTKIFQTVIQEPYSIRGSVGITDTRN